MRDFELEKLVSDLASSMTQIFPMPVLAPVTMATLPLRSGMSAAEKVCPNMLE